VDPLRAEVYTVDLVSIPETTARYDVVAGPIGRMARQ
jgi:hypothetical protein